MVCLSKTIGKGSAKRKRPTKNGSPNARKKQKNSKPSSSKRARPQHDVVEQDSQASSPVSHLRLQSDDNTSSTKKQRTSEKDPEENEEALFDRQHSDLHAGAMILQRSPHMNERNLYGSRNEDESSISDHGPVPSDKADSADERSTDDLLEHEARDNKRTGGNIRADYYIQREAVESNGVSQDESGAEYLDDDAFASATEPGGETSGENSVFDNCEEQFVFQYKEPANANEICSHATAYARSLNAHLDNVSCKYGKQS